MNQVKLGVLLTIFMGLFLLLYPSMAAYSSSVSLKCPVGMTFITGGSFRIGDNDYYAEEQSAEDVQVGDFCIDQHEITNAEFSKFINQTGYITIAERPLSVEQFPELSEAERQPGSMVFTMPPKGQETIGYLGWWKWVQGASWKHPQGRESTIEGKENHPVVHIAFADAVAYAEWAEKSLPTEAQWEYAARGGLDSATYSWGKQYSAKKANTWQGIFPFFNTQEDGYQGTAPVGSFPPNNYGLFDMTGNVWEWTRDWYQVGHETMAHQLNPVVENPEKSFDPRQPGVAKHVIKGGSYLCAKNYCSRYRPAAREAQEPDTGTNHVGFRLVKNLT